MFDDGREQQRRERIFTEFAVRERRQNVISGVAVVSIGLAALAAREGAPPTFLGLSKGVVFLCGMAVGFGCIAVSYVQWCCPSCSRYLGNAPYWRDTCYHCGIQLREPRDPKQRAFKLLRVLIAAGIGLGVALAMSRK